MTPDSQQFNNLNNSNYSGASNFNDANNTNQKQKINTPIIILSSIIIILLITCIGIFVHFNEKLSGFNKLNSNKAIGAKSENSINDSNKDNGDEKVKENNSIKPKATNNDSITQNPNHNSQNEKYIYLEDWGVKIKKSDKLKNLSYNIINTQIEKSASFLAAPINFDDKHTACFVNGGEYERVLYPNKTLTRSTNISSDGLGALTILSHDQVAKHELLKNSKPIFKNERFAFFYSGPQASMCMTKNTETEANIKAQGEAIRLIKEMIETISAI